MTGSGHDSGPGSVWTKGRRRPVIGGQMSRRRGRWGASDHGCGGVVAPPRRTALPGQTVVRSYTVSFGPAMTRLDSPNELFGCPPFGLFSAATGVGKGTIPPITRGSARQL